MNERSTEHATFSIDRTYDAPPARVFAAWADPEAKARWFGEHEEAQAKDREFDFRVGGRERMSGGLPAAGLTATTPCTRTSSRTGGSSTRMTCTSTSGASRSRWLPSSSSPPGTAPALILTEQGVYLDGADQPAAREQGTRDLLDSLDTELRRDPAVA